LLLTLYRIIYDLLTASLEHLLLENGGLVSFAVVPPVVELIVTGFDHRHHAATS
jgi:hypothetical protein